ncbi:MAG: hypothetical protein RLZZ628_4044 [Bacteroidota bacterium]|jgi:hypothetical protein
MEQKNNLVNNSTIVADEVHIGDIIINRYDTQNSVLNLVIFTITKLDINKLHGCKIKEFHSKLSSLDVTKNDNYDRAFEQLKEKDFCAKEVQHHYGVCPSEWKPFCSDGEHANTMNIQELIKNIFKNRISINLIYIHNTSQWDELKQSISHNQFMPHKAVFIFDSVALLHPTYRALFNRIYPTLFGGVIALTYWNLPNDAQQYLRVIVREAAEPWHDGRKIPTQYFYLHLGDEYLFEKMLLTTTHALSYNTDVKPEAMKFNPDNKKGKNIPKKPGF